jgi:hypothetical protein
LEKRETKPVESDMVLEHIGTAIPVHVNFAISAMDRVVRSARRFTPAQERGPAAAAGKYIKGFGTN